MTTKFSQFISEATKRVTEAKDLFADVDVIKLDPDRADTYDIVSAIMPTLVRIAYTNLYNDKVKYDRTHTDKEDTPFDFTKGALEEELDKVIEQVRDRLEMSTHDRLSYIDKVKSEFKDKLEDK